MADDNLNPAPAMAAAAPPASAPPAKAGEELVRATSTKAPYRRGGLSFAPKDAVRVVARGALSDDELRRLADDPAITLESSSDDGATWTALVVADEAPKPARKK